MQERNLLERLANGCVNSKCLPHMGMRRFYCKDSVTTVNRVELLNVVAKQIFWERLGSRLAMAFPEALGPWDSGPMQ